MSDLALKLIKEAKDKRLTRLDLGNCGLTELPDALFKLVWLEELILSNEKDYFDLNKKEWIKFESPNIGPKNNIRLISSQISQLEKLETLFIAGTIFRKWQFIDITPLRYLLNLKLLSVAYSQVTDLSVIKSLTNLQQLAIWNTQVSDLSPLKNLLNLKVLNISSTKVNDLSPIKKLHNLQVVSCYNTQVNDLSPFKDLIQLKQLQLCRTKVSDLSPLKKQIEKGIFVKWADDGDGILVEGCPLSNPPRHIVEEGNEAILRYWQELENKETQTNNQTKLIFIGNSRAGKTSLWQFLKDKIYNEQADSTHGIKTEIWDTESLGTEDNQNLAAHIWDFGGQEYYHATHRLFLADNAVYVLVWEHDSNKQGTRLEKFKLDDDPNGEIEEVALEHFPASYWLDNIRYFGGAHCPVLIVQNKMDSKEDFSPHTEGVSETADCFHLSIKNAFERLNTGKTDYDFEKFKETLLEFLRKNATAFKLVKYYSQVREALEALAKDTEYIPVSELKNIALRFDETPDLENLLAYLKSFTNTVLYFPQNDILNDRLYLNPTHISRDIYKILNKTVRDNNGKFDLTHIKTRLNLTDDQEAERFLALMHEFDLIFEKQDENGEREFIAPQYLQQKDHLARGEKLILKTFQRAFYLRFKSFVPRSLMLRFIAQNGAAAFEEFYWRNGIVYQGRVENTFIKVEYDSEARTFTVEIQDKQKQAVDMQHVVAQFVKLNNSEDNIEISNDGKSYFDLRKICNLQNQKRTEIDNNEGQYTPLSNFDWLIEKPKIETTMTLEELKAKVHSFISKAKTKEAMEAIATWAHEQNQEQLKSDIALLQGDFTDFSREKTLGLLNNSEASTRQTQLNYKVMNLVNAIQVSELKAKTPSMAAETAQKKTRDKPLSIFISYSKNDNDLRQELHTHLSSLRRRKIVSNWDDRHIIGGELWDDTIKTKLKEADIILFLVSANFINTDYIWEHEIPIAEEQRKNDKARVIPIILKPCQWTKLDFAKQQALPSKGVPINSFPDRDAAWLEVVESIEKVIDDVLEK